MIVSPVLQYVVLPKRTKLKPPSRQGQRAKCFRGTTSGSPSPRGKRPRGVPTHSRAVTGAPGARLLGFGKSRWGASSKVYSPSAALPFSPTRGSLGSAMTGTGPLLRCMQRVFYPIRAGLSIKSVKNCEISRRKPALAEAKKAQGMALRLNVFPWRNLLPRFIWTSDRPPPRPAALPRSPAGPPSPWYRR